MFTDRDGSFSWRKAGSALAFLLFAFCVIGHQIKNDFAELPASYTLIISGIVAFYFVKRPLENISFSKKSNDVTNAK